MVLMGTLGERVKKEGISLLRLCVDNSSVVHVTNTFVASSRPMMRELRRFKKVLNDLGLELSSEWIPSVANKFADALSRRFSPGDIAVRQTDAAAFRRGWNDGVSRLVPLPATKRAPCLPPPPVPQRIGIALVPRGNATALSASGTHGSSGEEATDIQSTCPPPNARLAEAIMVPAGLGYEYQDASPAASPGISLDRDTTTESILASPTPRSEPASRRAPIPADPALTKFPFDGSDMTTGGAARARRLLEDFSWSTRTIGSRSTKWKAYQEFCGHDGLAIVPVNEGQLVAYVGWLTIEREAGR
jgi:hypothetical protein